MISDATVDRYYYIFDSREHRALVLDRTTGEEMAWRSVPRVQLIDHVGDRQSDAVLRRFAQWCARRTGVEGASADTPTGRLWAAAQREEEAPWTAARAEGTDAVVRAAALGLPRRRPEAARLLAAHACTHPSARQAAIDAAHMSERWAEFEALDEPEATVRALRQRHIDWLLDALGAAEHGANG
jgi:glycerophosphoryl diester phosphodiesterase